MTTQIHTFHAIDAAYLLKGTSAEGQEHVFMAVEGDQSDVALMKLETLLDSLDQMDKTDSEANLIRQRIEEVRAAHPHITQFYVVVL